MPECYGNGIYKYWSSRKNAIKLLINGIREEDPLSIFFGSLFTGLGSVKPAVNIYQGDYYSALFPKEECLKCPLRPGCFTAAVALITNEVGVEVGEYLQDLKKIDDKGKFLPK